MTPATDLQAGTLRCRAFRLDLDVATHLPTTQAQSEAPLPERRTNRSQTVESTGAPEHVETIVDHAEERRSPATSLEELLNRPGLVEDPTIDIDDLDLALDEVDTLAERSPAHEGSEGADTSIRWQLRFTDGRTEPIDTTLVVGRAPVSSTGERPVAIDCARMSGSHVRIASSVDGLLLTDLASSNKTWVVTGDEEPTPLDAHTATLVGPSAHVQIGSKVFTIEPVSS